MGRRRAVGALLFAALLLVAGCGSSTTADSVAGSTTAVPGPSASSAGCERPDAGFAEVGAGGTIMSNGTERVFTLEVPDDVGDDEPLPLVVDMHGAMMDRKAIEELSRLSDLGAREHFIVATPQALGVRPIWDLSESGPDVAYVESLIDEIELKLCVDTNRVYLTGFSMGGMMSMVLACRDPERYAAIAPVAGAISVDNCARPTPVPLLAFHGTADSAVRFDGTFDGSVAFVIPYASGSPRDQVVREWAETNGCSAPATDTEIPPDVDHDVYQCPNGGAVEMYVVDDGGHTWPGSTPGPYSAALAGKTTQTIDASDLIWSFFQQHGRTG